MKTGHKVLAGCGIAVGLLAILILIVVVGLGMASMSGRIPDTKARSGEHLPEFVTEKLIELGVIERGEKILYLYSGGMRDYAEDGNLFTPNRVISYETEIDTDEFVIYDATWSEIEEIEFEKSNSLLDDSTITVTKKNGEWFILIVSNEESLDEEFYRELKKLWQKNATKTLRPHRKRP
ncbi:MAG: hypothetical protein HKN23_10805 [Verrucomicrobiales bacterium]|nr:hypothetical protein [Verrucomicrobiales bacterium]